jgi:formyl-CoA transferase
VAPLCEALQIEELAPRPDLRTNTGRVKHRQEVETAIAQRCATRSTAYWLARLRERGLLGAPIRTVGQAVEDPATRALGLFVQLEGYPGVTAPRLDSVPTANVVQHVPRLGEHTEEVLAELLGPEERQR